MKLRKLEACNCALNLTGYGETIRGHTLHPCQLWCGSHHGGRSITLFFSRFYVKERIDDVICWKKMKPRIKVRSWKRCWAFCFLILNFIFSAKAGNLGTLKTWVNMSWWLSMLQEEKSFGSTHKPIEPLGIKSHWAISFHWSESGNQSRSVSFLMETKWLIVSYHSQKSKLKTYTFLLNMIRIFNYYSANSIIGGVGLEEAVAWGRAGSFLMSTIQGFMKPSNIFASVEGTWKMASLWWTFLGWFCAILKVKKLAGTCTYSWDTIVTIVTHLYQLIYRSIYDRFDVIDVMWHTQLYFDTIGYHIWMHDIFFGIYPNVGCQFPRVMDTVTPHRFTAGGVWNFLVAIATFVMERRWQ